MARGELDIEVIGDLYLTDGYCRSSSTHGAQLYSSGTALRISRYCMIFLFSIDYTVSWHSLKLLALKSF